MRNVGLARIQIHRGRTPWTDRLRSYTIRIDGEEVGEIQHDEAQLLCHGRNPLLALYWITAGRNRYIALRMAAEPRRS
jgi:hypothetical protein